MNLDLGSLNENQILEKHSFNLKSYKKDGLFLQTQDFDAVLCEEIIKNKFIHTCFNNTETCLCVADSNGNLFVINLKIKKYWQLQNIGLVTFISFSPLKEQELLVSLNTASLKLCHIETGFITGSLLGHTAPATDVSYSDDGFYCLTFNNLEAIVWNVSTYDQIHTLSLKVDTFIKKVLFIPITNYILACFEDDTINIWQFGTFECIKQIIPETSKVQYLKTIAISKNGKLMVIGGHTSYLVIYCLETWFVKKIIKLPENMSGTKQLEFVPQVFDGGSNDILAILTTSLELYFFNIQNSKFLIGMNKTFGVTEKITISSTGKYFASVLNTGKINLYLTEVAITNKDCLKKNLNVFAEKTVGEISETQNSLSQIRKTEKYTQSLNDVRNELKKLLNFKKLHPILKQFGEFPEFYRTLIWKTILQLPENQDAFLSLATKTCHPSYTYLESKYPLYNKSLCNSLKKLLSSLSYWCPLFGEVDFLPEFIFPFVKLFHTDLVGCFETVATIIVNWCQNWFEFYPFPPVNMLSTLENILGHHEPDLLEFYLKNNITLNVSVCSIFHSAFSEVLSKTDWLRLWDHILSNEPSFLFMAIIAYNINCRNAIKCMKNRNEIEKFFRNPNPIDVAKLISKTYFLLKETPNEIHCRQFFTPYRPLSTGGTYVSFFAYPKLIDSNVTRMLTLRKEEEEIIAEQMRALDLKRRLDKKLMLSSKEEEHEKIYEELEERIKSIVDAEEDRILAQRQKLQDLRQELRLKELQLLEGTKNKALKKKTKKKKVELDRLIKDISKKKALEKTDIELIEEEKRKYYTKILKKMCQIELELGLSDSDSDFENQLSQKNDLKENRRYFQNSSNNSLKKNNKLINPNKTPSVTKLLNDVKTDITKNCFYEPHTKLHRLKSECDVLENQPKMLLSQNVNETSKKSKEKIPLVSFKNFESNRYMCPVLKEQHINNSNSNFKMKTKTIGLSSPQSNVGSIKTIRKKRKKVKKSNVINQNESNVPQRKVIESDVQKTKLKQDEQKSMSEDSLSSLDETLKTKINQDERISKDKNFIHSMFTCDSSQKLLEHSTKKKNLCEGYSFKSDSENEIFKTVLRIRRQLLQNAEIMQKFK